MNTKQRMVQSYRVTTADILCDEYKVITHDRRANARSTMHDPQNFEISHHGSYMDMPQEWAATLSSVLHKAETVHR